MNNEIVMKLSESDLVDYIWTNHFKEIKEQADDQGIDEMQMAEEIVEGMVLTKVMNERSWGRNRTPPADEPGVAKPRGGSCAVDIGAVEERTKKKKLVKGKVTVDSGAGESVWPEGVLGKTDEIGAQSVGFVAANGAKMRNLGKKKVVFIKDKKKRSMGFHVTEVKKPLAAVSRIAEKGNIVQFGPTPHDCFIMNIETKEKMMMRLERGTYVLDVEFEVDEDMAVPIDLGFLRQE